MGGMQTFGVDRSEGYPTGLGASPKISHDQMIRQLALPNASHKQTTQKEVFDVIELHCC